MLEDKGLNLLTKIHSNTPKYVALRVLFVSTISILIFEITKFFFHPVLEKPLLPYIIIVCAFNSIMKANLLIIKVFNHYQKEKKHIVLQGFSIIILTFVLAFCWIEIAEKLLNITSILTHPTTNMVIVLGLCFIIFIHFFLIIAKFAEGKLAMVKELESLKEAKLRSDYNSLQDRLNPHFLFNNLSVLKSMIRYSPDAAENFTQNFTDVYRYVLKSQESDTVMLERELEFLESYLSLHKERIGEGLKVEISINDAVKSQMLPPLSLQLLAENAIKHNIASRTKPLTIRIAANSEHISVSNNINLKASTYSTHTGLSTLTKQYQLLSNKEVEIISTPDTFEVKLPLLIS